MVFYFEMRLFGFSFNRHACGASQQSYSAAFRAKPCPGAMQEYGYFKSSFRGGLFCVPHNDCRWLDEAGCAEKRGS
jgi:hypothetical protein